MLRTGADVVVRRAKASDCEALAGLFAASWRTAYRGIIPDSHLERLLRRRGLAWWRDAVKTESHLLVLEAAGKIAGYATCGASRAPGRYKGEIFELYLLPSYQGVGLGEYLFEACRSHLDSRGLDGLIVWALSDNTLACDFYRRRGGRPVGRDFERFGNVKREKTAYGWL